MSTQLLFTKMIFCNKIADNYRESGIGNRESGIGNRESGIGNRESGIGNRDSSFLFEPHRHIETENDESKILPGKNL